MGEKRRKPSPSSLPTVAVRREERGEEFERSGEREREPGERVDGGEWIERGE